MATSTVTALLPCFALLLADGGRGHNGQAVHQPLAQPQERALHGRVREVVAVRAHQPGRVLV